MWYIHGDSVTFTFSWSAVHLLRFFICLSSPWKTSLWLSRTAAFRRLILCAFVAVPSMQCAVFKCTHAYCDVVAVSILVLCADCNSMLLPQYTADTCCNLCADCCSIVCGLLWYCVRTFAVLCVDCCGIVWGLLRYCVQTVVVLCADCF